MKNKEAKNQFSKISKISLIVTITALALALLSKILMIFGFNGGVLLIGIAIGANLIAFVSLLVFTINQVVNKKKDCERTEN